MPELKKAGLHLFVITPEKTDYSTKFVRSNSLSFEVLADYGNRVAGLYGLKFKVPAALKSAYQYLGVELSQYNGDASWTLPLTGTFLVQQNSKIVWRHVEPDYRFRVQPEHLLKIARSLLDR